MAKIKATKCNHEMDLHLFYDDALIAKKYRIDIPKKDMNKKVDDENTIKIGVKADHHPMNREDRRRYTRSEKKHLEKLSKYSDRVRITRNGAYTKERKNDRCRNYFRDDKKWNKKIRYKKMYFNEEDLTDNELKEFFSDEEKTYKDNTKKYDFSVLNGKYNIETIRNQLNKNFEPNVYIVEYSYDSYEYRYNVDNYFTTIDEVINEIEKHIIDDDENDLTILGLYPSDVNKYDSVMLYYASAYYYSYAV